MENKQTGRVVGILIVLLLALYFIFPQPGKLLQPIPWSQKTSLKAGIDMAGGTSLLYQIKVPEGGYHPKSGNTLAEDETTVLKKRIDPDGVKNLIWRPQGTDRIEIQLPASPQADQATAAREAYVASQQQLEATNVSPSEVTSAVEHLSGDARAAKLNALSQGLPARRDLFAQMAQQHDAEQAAHAKQQADAEAIAADAYDKLKAQVDATNLKPQQLEAVLTGPADQRASGLADLKKQGAGDPARVAAIDNFASRFEAFNGLKDAVSDVAAIKRELQGSGLLEFHILATLSNGLSEATYTQLAQQLRAHGPRPQAGDQMQWFQLDRPEGFHYGGMSPTQQFNGKQYVLCWITPERSMINGPGIPAWSMVRAFPTSSRDGGSAVGFEFDVVGGNLFHDFTANNLKQPLTAILDKRVVSTANIESAIGRDGTISGNYDDAELSYLVETLSAGSLPGQLEPDPISEQTVGPQLGQDNLMRGLLACGFGLVIVAVFLVSYYYLAGLVAAFAVAMNVLLILGVLAAFGATFTLPGIAGIVLTIGAAVDANVLIFERLREEQHHGLGLRMALDNAYTHAQTAIFDSNATTVITSLILYWLGSEDVKGFGLTLLIGLLSSLFTSLFVTRTIFNILIDTVHIKNLSSFPLTFPKWDKLLKPNINWMRLVPYFCAFSAAFILIGGIAFFDAARRHQLADVDFTGGTQVQFDLNHPTPINEVRALFDHANNPALPGLDLTSAGNDGKSYRVVTPNVDAKGVRAAVLATLGKERVTTDLPSTFDHVNEPVDHAMNTAVLPIDHVPFAVNGFTLDSAQDYLGGAAIVLNNLNPPLKLDEVRNRIERERVQEQANRTSADAPQFHDFTVVSPDGPNVPTHTAIILTVDPAFPYDKDASKWTTNLTQPMWQLVSHAVDQQGTLQNVTQFNAQVAGDTQQAALGSLVLSSLVIMAYIWFRFGNLKYGAATVLAMIHDVLLVLAAVGLAHWVVQFVPPLARLLLLEPFRVNMTLVAAVLTVMSYSMIDTIVVFDRIRENRGRFGHLSRGIINDSVNQTLSRTLLTAGTTIVTVAGMYVVGGPGVHGFTFVLLIGILVGTYSSIAIAAPILLMGRGDEPETRPLGRGRITGVPRSNELATRS